MNKILILNLFLLSVTNVLPSTEVAQPNNNESIYKIMDNLAEHTASVNNDRLTQFLASAEYAVNNFVENMEFIITSAMNELKEPIENYQTQVSSMQCQAATTLDQLNQQIDSDLSKCTEKLNEILNTFKQDVNNSRIAFEDNIKEILNIPKKCAGEEYGADLGSQISCYIENIYIFNQKIANILHIFSETVAHAVQLGKEAYEEGRTCGDSVILSTVAYLDKIVASCQLIEQ